MVPPQPRLSLRRHSRAPDSRPDHPGQPPKPVDPEHSAAQGGSSDDHRALERWKPFNGTLVFRPPYWNAVVRLRSAAANSSATDNGPGVAAAGEKIQVTIVATQWRGNQNRPTPMHPMG
jgi:hypothetical protein